MDTIAPTIQKDYISRFKILGLSTHAAKAYLSLLSHPHSSAVDISKETGIPDSKIYYALDELTKKGLTNIQQSRPNIYIPIHPKEAIANLEQHLTSEYEQKLKLAQNLASALSPMMDTSAKQEEVELAYVIRGKEHIIRRMKEMIGTATQEITLYISERDLFIALIPLIEGLGKKIKLRIALSGKLLTEAEDRGFTQIRHLPCDCSLVIVDEDIFLKVSSWSRGIAIVSRDDGLITMLNEYYETPCCGS